MTDLVTRDDYKDFKGMVSDTQNTVIDEIVPLISKFVENYCNNELKTKK